MAYKTMPKPGLTIAEKWCNGFLVTYPVSYRYNGGIIYKDKLYEGFTVPNPDVPKGYKLTPIYCGLQLNARPPYATNYLEPEMPRR